MSVTAPTWAQPWARAAEGGRGSRPPWPGSPPRAAPVTDGAPPVRRAAVLVLLGPGDGEPEVLLTTRAAGLRSHAGQVAFPGGGQDAEDVDDRATALREAQEEVGLDPSGVQVLGELPTLWAPPSRYEVVPVLAWWQRPHALAAVDRAEVAGVTLVPLADLVDPANRFGVRYPAGRGAGPGFRAGGLYVWGFSAALLGWVLDLAGLAQPWDPTPRFDHLGLPLSDAVAAGVAP